MICVEWVKAGTHKRACSRSMLLQHAPRAKFPHLHQQFLAKKYAAQQNVCSLISNWFDMREQAPGANLLHESVSGALAPSCVLKFACHEMMCLQLANEIGLFFSSRAARRHVGFITTSSHASIGLFHHSAPLSCPLCVLLGVLTRERVPGACFRSKLPCVYRP